MFLLGVFLTVK